MSKIKSKRQLLILLLILPTSLLFSLMIPFVNAKEYVPTTHPKNQWFWHDDILPGELLIFEEESVVVNFTTGELISQYRMLNIYNITGFLNVSLDGSLYPDWGDTSVVLGEQLYYNCSSDELLMYNTTVLYGDTGFGDDLPLAMFGYNDTRIGNEEHYIGMEGFIAPVILPINGTVLEVDKMAGIINSTYFKDLYQSGEMNAFDSIGLNIPANEIYFSSNDGYFMDLSYFANGTIKDFACSILMKIGPGPMDLIVVNATLTRVFKYDYLLDGVEWSFNEGDSFYFGDNQKWHDGSSGSDPEFHYDELEIKIIEIGNETVEVKGNYGNSYFQCFSYVLANISYWNYQFETYEPMMDDPILMGMANALCPANMMEIMGGEIKYFEDKNIMIQAPWNSLNITVNSHSNNQSWQGAEISMLTAMNGNETGERYEILDVYLDEPLPNQITLTIDKPHTYGVGTYFNIRPMPFERPEFVFYPMNTDPKDVAFVTEPVIYHMPDFDNFYSFSDGSFVMNHTSRMDERRGKYNPATGVFEWTWSKDQDGEFRSIQFRKNHTMMPIGSNERILYPQDYVFTELGNTQVYVNYTSTSITDIYSAVLPFNPVLEPFNAELNTMPIYVDLYTTYPSMISNIFLRVEYDETLLPVSFNETDLTPYGFDMYEQRWEECPDAFYDVYPTQNEIVIFLPTFQPNVTYYAIGGGEEWDWGVDIGDIMTFFSRGKVQDTNGIWQPYNDFNTLNVTSFPEVIHNSEDYTGVEVTRMYYDPGVLGLVSDSNSIPHSLGEFAVGTSDFKMWLDENTWGIPTIVPLRYGSLDLWEVGRALCDPSDGFFRTIEADSMGYPAFSGYIVTGNNLHLSIVGDKYMDLTYYDNGTLQEYDVYSTYRNDGTILPFKIQGAREFDVNPVNEIQWGVNIGDDLYFGNPTEKNRVVISSFSNTTYNIGMSDLRLSLHNASLVFSTVYANISTWNMISGLWDPTGTNQPIAMANDYFLFSMNIPNPILLPSGTTGGDILQCFQPFMNLYDLEGIVGVGDDYIRLVSDSSSSASSTTSTSSTSDGAFMDWYFDSSSGISDLSVSRIGEMSGRYRMMNESVTIGNQLIGYQSSTLPGFTATANITSTVNMEIYYAMISDIPTSVTLGNGTILFFSDLLIPDKRNITSLTFTFELPSSFNPLENFENYHFWIWDEGLTGGPDFRELTTSEIASAIVAWDSNSITVDFLVLHENSTSINIIFAITIGSEGLLVPGYDIILILGAIGLGSIVIYIKKRRKLEI